MNVFSAQLTANVQLRHMWIDVNIKVQLKLPLLLLLLKMLQLLWLLMPPCWWIPNSAFISTIIMAAIYVLTCGRGRGFCGTAQPLGIRSKKRPTGNRSGVMCSMTNYGRIGVCRLDGGMRKVIFSSFCFSCHISIAIVSRASLIKKPAITANEFYRSSAMNIRHQFDVISGWAGMPQVPLWNLILSRKMSSNSITRKRWVW